MKTAFTYLLAVCTFTFGSGQPLSIQTVPAESAFMASANGPLSITPGEPASPTFIGVNAIPSQGFHQRESVCAIGEFLNGEVCQACPQGHYCPGDEMKYPCDKGYAQSKEGEATCIKCEPGRYQDESGQLLCKPCNPGSYQDISGQVECKECDGGTYQEGPGAINCSNCDPGTFSKRNARECQLCPPGTSNDSQMAEFCPPCAEGSFAAGYGNIICEACPSGVRSLHGSARCLIGDCDGGMADLTLTGAAGQKETQNASATITSSQTVSGSDSVTYTAAVSITLNPGFRAVSGSDFLAAIEICDPPQTLQQLPITGIPSDNLTGELDMQVYPNPANKQVQIRLSGLYGNSADIFIFDQVGRVVGRIPIEEVGPEAILLNLSLFPNGIFYLQARSEGLKITRKLVVARPF